MLFLNLLNTHEINGAKAHNPKVTGSSPVPATRTPVFTGVFSFSMPYIHRLCFIFKV